MENRELSKEDKELLEKLEVDQLAREKSFLENWGASPVEIIAATFAYKGFIEVEQRKQKSRSFYATPLARRSFMVGWILANKNKAGDQNGK